MSVAHRRIFIWSLVASLSQAAVAATIAAKPQLYGRVGVSDMQDDVRRYEQYSSEVLAGKMPYRDYTLEYPPLSLPIFVVPGLGTAFGFSYRVCFVTWMLIVNAVVTWLVAWWVARHEGAGAIPARFMWLLLATTSLSPMIVLRYDLAPAALAFAAICLWGSGRPILGGIAAGSGFLMKVFPAVVAIAAFVSAVRSGGRRAHAITSFVLISATGLALWLVLGGSGAVWSIEYHASRPLEIGSLYSGIAFAVAKALGRTVIVEYQHASMELTTPWTITLASLALPIQAAALLAVAVRALREPTADPIRVSTAALVAYIAFGKVLSPQYMIWVLPFVAALPNPHGRRARALCLISCALTTLLYPWGFERLIDQTFAAVVMLNVRNALLVAVYAVLLTSTGAQANLSSRSRLISGS